MMTLSNPYTHDARVQGEARSLARAGYEVTILAWSPGGTPNPQEGDAGIRVLPIPSSRAMRATPWALARLPGLWRRLYRQGRSVGTRVDLIHAHDFDTLPAAVRLKRHFEVPLVYDAHEMFAYLVELSRARPLAAVFAAAERLALRNVDHVLAAGPRHAEYFRDLGCDRTSVLMHCRDPPSAAYVSPRNERMRVVYIGGLEAGRLLLPLAELASEDPAIEVRLGGRGPLEGRIRSLCAAAGGNLTFLGLVPSGRVLAETLDADVVVATFDPSFRIHALGAPNKLFEALACGRPIVVSRGTWAAEVVTQEECGLAIDYSKDALRTALRLLRDDPALRARLGRNALRAALERYNWAQQERTLLRVYRELLDGRVPPANPAASPSSHQGT